MASTIKGITVKIAGDTMDLQKSLKAVQSYRRAYRANCRLLTDN